MNLFEKISHIYIQVEPCDLRKGIDGYAALVNSEFNMDPMDSNSLYIFCNRNHNKLKCLYYDGTGFWLLLLGTGENRQKVSSENRHF